MSQEVKETLPNIQTDSAWKDILNVWFPEFMSFFYPELAEKINWSAGYETLDKELQMISTQAMLGNRFVDKLIKVKSQQGEELWVLLHIEVQGEKQTHFEKRLFEYYYRLHDRYNIPILTLAVLADGNHSWRPSTYQANVWEKEILSFRFFTTKLLDYMDVQEILEQTSNPFGIIVLAQLAALKTQKDIDTRLKIKFSLTRKLYDRGLDRDTIINLYKFIDWILTLPKALGILYNEYLHQIEEEYTVAYITTAERIGMEKGYEQGMEKGIEKGIEKGLVHERTLLKRLLTRRFGHLSSNTISMLEQADPDTLLLWGEKILDAKTIKDVFGE